MEDEGEVASNKQVLFKDYVVAGTVKESDMYLNSTSTIELKGPSGCDGILVKNLYLSCAPYMWIRMRNFQQYSSISPFNPGSPLIGPGVAKVMVSGSQKFKEGDLVWRMTSWEEYILITATETLFKIPQTDVNVPLSYYLGILGNPGFTAYSGFYEICSSKKGSASSSQQHVVLLVILLASLQNCMVAMLLVLLEAEKRDIFDRPLSSILLCNFYT